MKLPSWLRSFWSGIGVGIIVVAVLFIVGGLSWLAWCYWWDCSCREWLVTGSDSRESGSTTLRNLGFVVGGLLAIGFGVWRGVVASRQAKISQRGLLNERYQKGAEMLGSPFLSVRLGGIYALQHLAEDEPKQYHVQIMRLFCAFVHNPTRDKDIDHYDYNAEDESVNIDTRIRKDVQAAMTAIGTRSDADVELEKKAKFELDLGGAHLSHARLISANLADANLSGAVLFYARLVSANLTGANLTGAVLFNADLADTDLTGVSLTAVRGLTQEQLDQASAGSDSLPKLDQAQDSKSGNLLKWRHRKS